MSARHVDRALRLAALLLVSVPAAALAQSDSLKGWTGTIVVRDTELSDYVSEVPSPNNVSFGSERYRARYLTVWTIKDGRASVTHDERTWRQEHSGHRTWPLACTAEEYASGTGHLWEEHSRSRTETRAHFEGEGDCSLDLTDESAGMHCQSPTFPVRESVTESGSCTGCCDAGPDETQRWEEPLSTSEQEGQAFGGFTDALTGNPTVISGSKLEVEDGRRRESTWSLKRESAYVLEVQPKDYETWVPKASRSEDVAGNGLVLRATLKRKDGAPLDVGAKEVTFRLVDISSEPGVSMNFPPAAQAKATPDLRFEATWNKELQVAEDGMTATREGKALGGAYAVLSSFDFGAYGAVTVEAVLTTGEVVHGHLEGDETVLQILIPWRYSPHDPIAVAWREAVGDRAGDADGDNDTEPLGDLHQGDGLTLYEEYRGLHIGGRHQRLHPDRKELFVVNNVGTLLSRGARVFERASRIVVHDRLRREEVGTDRVVNFNTSGAYNAVAQHAVLANWAPPAMQSMRALGGPGTPGRIHEVQVSMHPIWDEQTDTPMRTVAHELAHSSSVPHHGAGDLKEEWEVQDGGIVAKRASGSTGLPIRVFREDGTTELLGWDALYYFSGRSAVPQGQHSGDRSCMMSYLAASALTRGAKDLRYIPDESWGPKGAHLCTDPAGTGVNAADHSPAPHCGPAMEGRGRCQDVLCINDLHH
jgi:hypothetical protein